MTRLITCLMCDGKGYVAQLSHDGVRRPIKCAGCNGTGRQAVRG